MDKLPTKSDRKRCTIGFASDEPHCLATVWACAVKGCFGVAVAVQGAYVLPDDRDQILAFDV